MIRVSPRGSGNSVFVEPLEEDVRSRSCLSWFLLVCGLFFSGFCFNQWTYVIICSLIFIFIHILFLFFASIHPISMFCWLTTCDGVWSSVGDPLNRDFCRVLIDIINKSLTVLYIECILCGVSSCSSSFLFSLIWWPRERRISDDLLFLFVSKDLGINYFNEFVCCYDTYEWRMWNWACSCFVQLFSKIFQDFS